MAKKPLELSWKEVPLGFVCKEYMSSLKNHTGSWRSERPIWNKDKCIKCGVCLLFCPESCIKEDNQGFFSADLNYCKGCAICEVECVTGCISMKPEEE